jgi:hypothetical protein
MFTGFFRCFTCSVLGTRHFLVKLNTAVDTLFYLALVANEKLIELVYFTQVTAVGHFANFYELIIGCVGIDRVLKHLIPDLRF